MERTLTLDELVAIIKETAVSSAPAVARIGEALSYAGQTSNSPTLSLIGEGVAAVARITVQVLKVLDLQTDIVVSNTKTTRGMMNEQRLVDMIVEQAEQQAHA